MSFHNAVSRYFSELGREEVLPKAFGRLNRSGSPVVGSLTQSLLALLATIGFIIADTGDPLFPVLTMFTWLTNTGAFGLVLLMVLVAIAVIAFFRRDARGVGVWSRLIAPAISGLALAVVFVLVLMNFDLMLGQEESNATTFILPALIIVPGIAGVLYTLWLRRARPERYALIGAEMTPKTEVVGVDELG
jgi:amino acid transporter